MSGILGGRAVQGPPMKTARSCPETTWLETIDLRARAVTVEVGTCVWSWDVYPVVQSMPGH